MTTNFLVVYILLIHFLADFGLQTNEQAHNKGEGSNFFNDHLFYHVGVYSLIWLIATAPLLGLWSIFFAMTTFWTHYVIDWFTSRIGKPFWKNGDYHNGFVVVGFDQMLHILQLWVTFKIFSL